MDAASAATLQPSVWINDTVVNMFGSLVYSDKVVTMSSFLTTKLLQVDVPARWLTRQLQKAGKTSPLEVQRLLHLRGTFSFAAGAESSGTAVGAAQLHQRALGTAGRELEREGTDPSFRSVVLRSCL
jgi:hypothetical protein